MKVLNKEIREKEMRDKENVLANSISCRNRHCKTVTITSLRGSERAVAIQNILPFIRGDVERKRNREVFDFIKNPPVMHSLTSPFKKEGFIRKYYFFIIVIVFILSTTSVFASAASSLDDMFEAVVDNSFRKAGKHIDDLSDLRKSADKATDLIKRTDIYKVPDKVDDVVSTLKKIDLPANSKFTEVFKSLNKTERLFISAIDDVTTKIAKLPNGGIMVKKVSKKGLMLGATYGEEAIKGTYRLAKNDDLWNIAKSADKIDDVAIKDLKRLGINSDSIKATDLKKFSKMDSADVMEKILPKYGVKGQKNFIDTIEELTRKGKEFISKHKGAIKATAITAAIATICLKPELILDPAGKVVDNVTNRFNDGLQQIVASASKNLTDGVASATSALVNAPFEGVKQFTKNTLPNAPSFIQTLCTYAILAVLFVILLYFIPITRPLPVAIGKYLKAQIASLSNKTASKIDQATNNIEQANSKVEEKTKSSNSDENSDKQSEIITSSENHVDKDNKLDSNQNETKIS